MATRPPRVESLVGFIEEVLKKHKRWSGTWYRGHGDVAWKLKPRFYRRAEPPDEHEIRIDFKRIGVQLVQRQPEDEWDWYS